MKDQQFADSLDWTRLIGAILLVLAGIGVAVYKLFKGDVQGAIVAIVIYWLCASWVIRC